MVEQQIKMQLWQLMMRLVMLLEWRWPRQQLLKQQLPQCKWRSKLFIMKYRQSINLAAPTKHQRHQLCLLDTIPLSASPQSHYPNHRR
ncbi:hypothetical protein ACFX13_017785 [Malus domestica]